jgi:phage terminase large subunit-like protein
VLLLQKYKRLNRKIISVTDEMSPGKKGANEMMLRSACNAKGLVAPTMIEISRAGKNKHSARIRPAATYWQDGHVRLLRTAPGLHKLMEQMSRLTPEMPYDDWADAAADVFNPLVYQVMARTKRAGRSEDWSNPTDSILKEALPKYPDREESNEFPQPI